MRPLIFLVALFAPALAQAGELENVALTIISYSKWVFMLVGAACILAAARRKAEGTIASKALYSAAFMAVIASVVTSIIDVGAGGRAASPGGRAYIEYMMAQQGLLSARLIASWKMIDLLTVVVFLGSIASLALRGKPEEAGERIMPWFVTAFLIYGAFYPNFTASGQVTSIEVVQKIGGKAQSGDVPYGTEGLGSQKALKNFSDHNFALMDGSYGKVPFTLSKINAALDELVASIVERVANKGFLLYGLAHVKSVTQNLNMDFGDPDLDRRAIYFVDNCWGLVIAKRMNTDPGLAERLASGLKGREEANFWNPFSKANMKEYARLPVDIDGGTQTCKTMVDGNYTFLGAAHRLGIADEVLAAAAFNDEPFRKSHGWHNLKDAQSQIHLLRRSKDFSVTVPGTDGVPKGDWLVARFFRKAAAISQSTDPNAPDMNQYTNPVAQYWSLVGATGTQIASNVQNAFETESVNLKMPVWMGAVQQLLLALFPIVWLFCLIPGQANRLGYYFLVLLWSKSYVIAWALLSNLDAWLSAVEMTSNKELAMVSVIQELQLYSPLIMAVVIFGPAVAGHSLSRGGGGA